MLIGKECSDRQGTQADLQLALARVSSLGFVGLTGEWDLSICLFHAMYGGDCLPVEFRNVRPGLQKYNDTAYDPVSIGLGNYNPGNESWDNIVYAAAKDTFWKNIQRYDVRRTTCLNIYCPQAAEYFKMKSGDWRGDSTNAEVEFNWPGRYAFGQD
jgi:hypothetical protein